MGAGHHHSHGSHPGLENRRRLAGVLILSAAYLFAEVIGGLASGSLALLADAGHMLSDVAALALALFAAWLARRPPSRRQTYGFHRTEILAALANGAALAAISIAIAFEAWERWRQPAPVAAPLMTAIAAGGLGINLFSLWLLHSGRNENLNLRGAWLHVLTDALGSVQAITAGALIWAFGWTWADPVASVLISALTLYSSWALLREAVSVLMESAPGHIDVDQVRQTLLAVPDVQGVHDLHIWTITSGRESLSAHVVTSDHRSPRELLADIRRALHDRFGIHHVTVQVEPQKPAEECVGCESG